jgi:hypothetical protein
MPYVGFEPTIVVFELLKTFHALDRAATVIGLFRMYWGEKVWFGMKPEAYIGLTAVATEPFHVGMLVDVHKWNFKFLYLKHPC